MLGRSSIGIEGWQYDPKSQQWFALPNGPAWSDSSGWNQIQYYSTIQCADIDGDGQANLLGRSAQGIQIWRFVTVGAGQKWVELSGGPDWSDEAGWAAPQYYSTIQCVELDGFGQAEILARSSSGIVVYQPEALTTSRWQGVLQKAMNDPVYKRTVMTNPIEVLKKAGIAIPEVQYPVVVKLVEFILTNPMPAGSIARRDPGDSSYISADANWYGLTIHLSHQAVADADSGLNVIAGINAAAAAALTGFSNTLILIGTLTGPQLAIVIGVISGYLWALGSMLGLMDRGNGVDLVVPWTSFSPALPPLGTAGLVIPVPR